MRTFKTYSLNNIQMCDMGLLTIVIVLYITSPRLTFITGNLYFLNPFSHFAQLLPSPASGHHQSALCIYEFYFLFVFLDST